MHLTTASKFLPRYTSSLRLLLGILLNLSVTAQAARDIPFLSGPVIDEAGFLSPSQKRQLEDQLLAQKSIAQIQIWTIPSLNGEILEELSIRAVDTWKLGDEKKDNGVLIIATREDRRLRIEVGRGLEGDIPDILSNRIIQNIIVPNFRKGQFLEGFSGAASAVHGYAGGQRNPQIEAALKKSSSSGKRNFDRFLFLAFLMFFFGFPFLGRILGISSLLGLGRRRGIWSGGSSSWSGGGGGGGWSGGGGGFGGGGSSGSW
jgi:uncharacterized protein